MYKIGTGELNLKDGLDEAGQMATATVVGLAASTKGTAIGAAAGSVFGPIGAAIGGVVGGAIGYMAGSKFGELVAKGAQKVRDFVLDGVKKGYDTVKSVGTKIKNFCGNVWESVFG